MTKQLTKAELERLITELKDENRQSAEECNRKDDSNRLLLKEVQRLREKSDRPSALWRFWDRCKPYIAPVLFLVFAFCFGIVGGQLNERQRILIEQQQLTLEKQQSTLEHQAALGGAAIPFHERFSLAESLELAARQLDTIARDGGDTRREQLLVDEHIRRVIGVQPTSGQWATEFEKIIISATSPDAVKYAENLRQIAKGLRQ